MAAHSKKAKRQSSRPKPGYRTLLRPADIRALIADRKKTAIRPPDHFVDPRFQQIKETTSYTPSRTVTVQGIATFENKAMTIRLSKQRGNLPSFSYKDERYALDPRLAVKGNHNIQLGSVKIIEHPLAMMIGLNLACDFELSESSFPTFDHCNRAYLDALADVLVPAGTLRKFSVSKPVALKFTNKGYVVLEPDDGSGALLVDHEVSYPGRSVGRSRIVAKVTAPFLAFASAARTPSFHPAAQAAALWELAGKPGNTGPFTRENVLLLDENKLFNPRPLFVHGKTNYEFMLHEILDVIAWIKFLEAKQEGKFAGRMTTFLFDHHAQVDAAQYFCSPTAAEKVCFGWL